MTIIHLKRYYPYMTEDVTLEVSDEIAAALSMGGRLCDSYKRQKRRNGECSLDSTPGFEDDVLHSSMTPDEYMEAQRNGWPSTMPSPSSRLFRPGAFIGITFSA